MSAVLVTYDVIDDSRRRKVHKALSRLGRQVQYSVFLVEERPPQVIRAAVEPLLLPAEDDLRIHPICGACAAKSLLLGRARARQVPAGFSVV